MTLQPTHFRSSDTAKHRIQRVNLTTQQFYGLLVLSSHADIE